jgi:hypothetical protein
MVIRRPFAMHELWYIVTHFSEKSSVHNSRTGVFFVDLTVVMCYDTIYEEGWKCRIPLKFWNINAHAAEQA